MSKDPKASYYDVGGIETLDIIKAKLGPILYYGYLRGSLLKYQCRQGHKDDCERDAEKIAIYGAMLPEATKAYNKAMAALLESEWQRRLLELRVEELEELLRCKK